MSDENNSGERPMFIGGGSGGGLNLPIEQSVQKTLTEIVGAISPGVEVLIEG